jgi:predicted dehydrogenase
MAGKHVLVEKPFTLTSGDGRDLANLAEEQGLILAPAHNFLFARSTRRAKEIIDSGKAGELRSAAGVQLSSWRRRLPDWFDRLPGGLFFDESPHLIYLMREFIGELDVETAWTSSAGQDTPNPFEHTVAGLRGDKADGLLTVWSGAPFSEWYLALICTNSVLVIDLFRDTLVELPAEKGHNMRDVIRISLSGTMQHWAGTIGSGLRILAGRGSYGHNRLIEQFVAAVDGRSDPPTSAEDGWRTIQVIESVLHKANSAAAETGG